MPMDFLSVWRKIEEDGVVYAFLRLKWKELTIMCVSF